MGIYAFLLFGSNFLASFFAGWINVAAGWRWVMWFGAIVQAIATVIIYFGMEETMYFRDTIEGIDQGNYSKGTSTPLKVGVTTPELEEKIEKTAIPTVVQETNRAWLPPRTWKEKSALFVKIPGRPSLKQLWTMMIDLFSSCGISPALPGLDSYMELAFLGIMFLMQQQVLSSVLRPIISLRDWSGLHISHR